VEVVRIAVAVANNNNYCARGRFAGSNRGSRPSFLEVSGPDVSGTDPLMRLSCIRLSPRVRDGEAFVWPRGEDRGLRELVVGGVLDAVSNEGRRSGRGGAACAPDVAGDTRVLARSPTPDGG